jgi:hypothetical protein
MDSVNRTWAGMGPAACRTIFSNFFFFFFFFLNQENNKKMKI